MADLNKLLVKVPANLCNAFRTKYLTGDGSNSRDTSYDKKIVFLEDTKDIFSQGKIYGTSYADFTQLQNKVNERSVTLTFNVNSFDNINEQGGPRSNAKLHYDAVSKAYDNGGIVKIKLNNPNFDENPMENPRNSAILSNIKKVETIGEYTQPLNYFTGTLCSNSIDGVVGKGKSYDITFRYDSNDATYGQGYYVYCKEIADTLYNRKFGGGEIQGDANGTFMEMINPGNDTLSLVLKQLLTNDVLMKQSLEPVEIVFNNVNSFSEINLTYNVNSDPSDSHIEDKVTRVYQAYNAGKVIKLTLNNTPSGLTESILDPKSAILSNLEFKTWTDKYGNYHGVLKGLLSPYTSSKSFEISFRNDFSMDFGDEYSIYCKKLESFGSAAYKDVSYFDMAGTAAEEAAKAQNNSYAYTSEQIKEAKTYVQDSLGSVIGKSDNEEDQLTIHGTRKYAYNLANTAYINAKEYTDSVLPTVSAGNNISIAKTTVNGKVNYKVSTTAKVFNYKGNKTTVEDLKKLTDNSQGDVWTVGAANAPGSSLYAWDGDEWINIGPADGVVDVNTNAKNGIGLTLDKGIVGISVTPGSVSQNNTQLVTGGTVYSYINSLSATKKSNNGTYVNVEVSTSGGKVTSVSVSETNNLKNAVNNANTALQGVNILGKQLTKDSNTITVEEAKTYLGLGTAAYKAENYFDKAGAAAAVEKKLPGIINGSGITVTPGKPDANGKITYTISQSINTTVINGVALKFVDSTSALGLSITTGKVSSSKFGDGAKLVTGYDVYEALCTYTIKEVKTNPENSTYITTAKRKYSDSAYSYSEISLNETAIYNYVIDNIWGEYSL